jgi:RNA processing factor Prp31
MLLTVPRRFKLKFSPDKVDTMVVQAIALLDDLDKEINIYSMRVKVRVQYFDFLASNATVPLF